MSIDLTSDSYRTLTERLVALHERLLEVAPGIERVAVALYDPAEDLLKTFLNSTHNGTALRSYQYKLADSESLSYLARTHELRLLTDIQNQLEPSTAHSTYVLEEGYESSFTVPLHYQGEFLGFLFFDSRSSDTFTSGVQRELELYASLVAMAIASEQAAVRTIIGTLQLARDFTSMRDVETGEHLERMARFARVIARDVSRLLDLPDELVESIFLYAPMHDIGKIGIPDAILLKPGRLTPQEFEIMKTHTTKGLAMVDAIREDLGLDYLPYDHVMRHIVELHHERLDGSGYPHGLIGEAIPVEARIVAVADVFDALTGHRPYKEPWTPDAAFAELVGMAARNELDHVCVDALIAARDEVLAIVAAYAETD